MQFYSVKFLCPVTKSTLFKIHCVNFEISPLKISNFLLLCWTHLRNLKHLAENITLCSEWLRDPKTTWCCAPHILAEASSNYREMIYLTYIFLNVPLEKLNNHCILSLAIFLMFFNRIVSRITAIHTKKERPSPYLQLCESYQKCTFTISNFVRVEMKEDFQNF